VSDAHLPIAVVDTSAIVAILEQEASAPHFLSALAACDDLRISAASHLELSLVVRAKKGVPGLALLDRLLVSLGVVVEAFVEPPHATLARVGAVKYGKGFSAAALNFGDLFSYATAKALDAPLFFQGFDFAQTDVREAMLELGYKFDAFHRPI